LGEESGCDQWLAITTLAISRPVASRAARISGWLSALETSTPWNPAVFSSLKRSSTLYFLAAAPPKVPNMKPFLWARLVLAPAEAFGSAVRRAAGAKADSTAEDRRKVRRFMGTGER
jgi:hypothetical protein